MSLARLLGSTLLACASVTPLSAATVYSETFDLNPNWTTDQPSNFFWNSSTSTYLTTTYNQALEVFPSRFAYIGLNLDVSNSFTLQWDHRITDRLGTFNTTHFGLFSPDLTVARPPGSSFWIDPVSTVNTVIGSVSGLNFAGLNLYGLDSGFDGSRTVTSANLDLFGNTIGQWFRNNVVYDATNSTVVWTSTDVATGQVLGSRESVLSAPFDRSMFNLGIASDPLGNPALYGVNDPDGYQTMELDNIVVTGDFAVPLPPKDTEKNVIYLNFDAPAPVSARYTENPSTGFGEYAISNEVVDTPQSIDLATKMALRERVQEIYDTVGANVSVVLDRPTDLSKEVTVVYFGSMVPLVYDSRGEVRGLLGAAYDVSPAQRVQPDQYNVRSDANVVVFGLPGDSQTFDGANYVYELDAVAKTIAHEVGHGYGLVHIEKSAHPATTMTSGETGLFFNSSPLLTDDQQYTHNAAYHLKAYVNDEVAPVGLEPGTWDTLGRDFYSIVLDVSGFFQSATNWYLGVVDNGSMLPQIAAPNAIGLVDVTARSSSGVFDFEFESGTTWSLYGSSGDAGVLDLVLGIVGPQPVGGIFGAEVQGSYLDLLKYDSVSRHYTTIGTVGVSVGNSPSVVPLPPSFLLLSSAFGLMVFFGNSRKKKKYSVN